MTTEKPNFREPDFLNISESLDLAPLGTAAEERELAKRWMDEAAAYARNADYWRDKRAYPAEECVRLLEIRGDQADVSCGDGFAFWWDEPLRVLVDHVKNWARPENPERFHQVPEQKPDPTSEPVTPGQLELWIQRGRRFAELAALERLKAARELVQAWLDKQGHDKCHYYPEIFRELAELFGLKPSVDSELPPLSEFKAGCARFQAEQYPGDKHDTELASLRQKVAHLEKGIAAYRVGRAASDATGRNDLDGADAWEASHTDVDGTLVEQSTVVTDADVLKLISAYKDLGSYNARTDWTAISNMIEKMEAAIAENAQVGKPEGVWVSRERLDQLEHAEDNLRVLKEHETHSRSMSFAELLDVHQRGAASLQHIGYLFLAAMREDKCFTIKMGPTIEITEHSEPQLKVVQGANGDYFIQHKAGLWRIEANGTIGSGEDAAASFREVLKELGTPAGSNGSPSETEKKEFLESRQLDLGTDE